MVIIEVGSSTTKAYLCENDKINKLKQKTILFKNHYKLNNKLEQQDKNDLFEFVLSINDEEIHVYGTSIFRNLTFDERKNWLIEFNSKTGLDFNIVSAQEENEYTVYGAIANTKYNGNIAVMIGGGGSTEIAVTNNGKIINYKYYESRLVVRKDNDNNFAYDLDNFKEKKGAVLDKTSLSIMADKSADGSFLNDNVPQSNKNVKSNSSSSTKYSMKKNTNNTLETDNSTWQNHLEENYKATGTRADNHAGYSTIPLFAPYSLCTRRVPHKRQVTFITPKTGIQGQN